MDIFAISFDLQGARDRRIYTECQDGLRVELYWVYRDMHWVEHMGTDEHRGLGVSCCEEGPGKERGN